jgi:hypothetical protein
LIGRLIDSLLKRPKKQFETLVKKPKKKQQLETLLNLLLERSNDQLETLLKTPKEQRIETLLKMLVPGYEAEGLPRQSEWAERELVFKAIFRLKKWSVQIAQQIAAAGDQETAQLLKVVKDAKTPDEMAQASSGLERSLLEWSRKALLGGRFRKIFVFPQPFFLSRRLEQSLAECKKESDKEFHRFRDQQLLKYGGMLSDAVELGTRRSSNVSLDRRYEWALLRWFGFSWNRIAAMYRSSSVGTIKRAGKQILRDAGLLSSSLFHQG